MTLGIGAAEETRTRLAALTAGGTPPEEALEPALRIVMQAGGASAGAICLYDPADAVLTLATEVGLSDDGCRALRRIGHEPGGWPVPLESVFERRVHVLDRAAGAALPSLVDPAESMRTVACLPLEIDGRPAACVVLVALAPWVIDQAALRAIAPALPQLAKIVEGIGRRAGTTSARSTPLPPAAHPAAEADPEPDDGELAREALERAHAAEVAHLSTRLSDVERAWAREHSLRVEQEHRAEQQRRRSDAEREAAVRRAVELAEAAEARRAAAFAEAQGLRSELAGAQRVQLETREELRRVRAESATGLGAIEAELAGLRAGEAEADQRWKNRLADVEQRLGAEHERARALEAERRVLDRRLEEALASQARTRADLEAAAARDAAHRDELRQAVELGERAEQARAAAVAEVEALRATLAQVQRQILDAEARTGVEHGEMLEQAVEAGRAAEEARRSAVAELEAARAALAAAQADALAARDEARQAAGVVARINAEAGRAGEREADLGERCALLEAACAAERERVADLEREVARRAEELEEAETRARHERELLAIVTEDRDGVLAQATALARAAEEARAAAVTEAEAIRGALASAQGVILEAEDAASRARGEAERLAAEAAAVRAERDQLSAALAEAQAHRAPSVQRPAPQEPAAPSPATPCPAAASAPGGPLVVIDDGGTVATPGPDVEVIAAGPQLAARLASLVPHRVLVNLAMPGALAVLADLRAGGYAGPVWGCLATLGAQGTLLLGAVEGCARPIDPDAIVALLAGRVARGARVLAVGDAPQSLISLRQALTRQGMSVSIGWDAKQAIDLVAMVRPEVVILDLALPRGGHVLVAELSATDPHPLLLLVPSEGDDAAAFGAALAARARTPQALTPAQLLDLARQAAPKPGA